MSRGTFLYRGISVYLFISIIILNDSYSIKNDDLREHKIHHCVTMKSSAFIFLKIHSQIYPLVMI